MWIVLGLMLAGVLFFLFRDVVSPRYQEVSDTKFNELVMEFAPDESGKAEKEGGGYAEDSLCGKWEYLYRTHYERCIK